MLQTHQNQDLKLIKSNAKLLVDERNGYVHVNSSTIYKRDFLVPYYGEIGRDGKALNQAYAIGSNANQTEQVEKLAAQLAEKMFKEKQDLLKTVEKEAVKKEKQTSMKSLIESAKEELAKENAVEVSPLMEEEGF